MRFTRKNWEKYFDGSEKRTTIRIKPSRTGHHRAYAGSYYKPVRLGEFDITNVIPRAFGELSIEDAIRDGFKSVEELKTELIRLNGKMDDSKILFIHYTENVKEANKDVQKGKRTQ